MQTLEICASNKRNQVATDDADWLILPTVPKSWTERHYFEGDS